MKKILLALFVLWSSIAAAAELSLKWGIWTTEVHPDKKAAPPRLDKNSTHSSYSECMKYLDDQLTDMEQKEFMRRVKSYEIQLIVPVPSKMTFVHECREIPPPSPS